METRMAVRGCVEGTQTKCIIRVQDPNTSHVESEDCEDVQKKLKYSRIPP